MPTQIKKLVETGWKFSDAILLMFYNWTQMFETFVYFTKHCIIFLITWWMTISQQNNLFILYVGTKDAVSLQV